MLKKLKIRFVTVTMCLVFLILTTIFSSIYFLMYKGGKNQSIMTMEMIAQKDGLSLKPEPPPFFKKQTPPQKKPFKIDFSLDDPNMHNSFSVKLDHAGNFLEVVFNLWDNKIDDAAEAQIEKLSTTLNASSVNSGVIDLNNTPLRFLKTPKPYGSIIVFLDRSLEIATLNRLIIVCTLIGILSFIILFVISLFLVDWAIGPIKKAWDKQKQFVADASHELRTPLTVIETNVDVVLANPQDTITMQSKWLDYIKLETQRMNKLIGSLLDLAKLDNDKTNISKIRFNLSDAMINTCLPFESIIFEANKTFNLSIEENLSFWGNEGQLKQLAIILLDNAIKNSNESGIIDFILSKEKEKIILSVTNSGPGISEEHLPSLFERFYRVDSSRARETGGYGLGLSIAKTIIENHNGKISVHSHIEGPTTFEVILPLKTHPLENIKRATT